MQWRSHWGCKRGQNATPDSEQIAKNQEIDGKIRKKLRKRGEIGKKRQKLGQFLTLPLLTDRAGYATA